MPSYSSPGVYLVEKDFSEYPPSINSSLAGIVGFASKGEPNKARLITSAAQLLREFGRPNLVTGGQGLLGALEVLTQTGSLYYLRVVNGTSVDASAAVEYGTCPAVAVSSTSEFGNPTNAKFKFGVKVTNNASANVTPAAGRDLNGYYVVTCPSASTGIVVDTISNGVAAVQTRDFPFSFVSSTSSTGPFGFFVGSYAGSGATIEVSATSAIGDATTYSDWGILGGLTPEQGDVSAAAGAVVDVGLGSTSEKDYPGGCYLAQSLWGGLGYNYSSVYPGVNGAGSTTYYGIQVKTESRAGSNSLLSVFNDGGFEEGFTLNFVKTDDSTGNWPENVINMGTTNPVSEFIKGQFYDVSATNTEAWTPVTAWDLQATLTNSVIARRNAAGTNIVVTESPVVRFMKFVDSTYSFSGGTNGDLTDNAGVFDADARTAFIGNQAAKTGMWALDDEGLNLSMAATPGVTDETVQNALVSIAESSQNLVAVLSPPKGLGTAQDAINWTNGQYTGRTSALNSSYAAVYWPWVKIFDVWTGLDTWVDPAAFAIGVMANTDQISDPWFAPAGLTRGRLTRPFDVEVPLSQGDRDILYQSGECINPIVKFANDGIVIWGNKTTQRTATALDRVNIRRMMIVIRKMLLSATRPFVFEPNDPVTWSRIKNIVQPALDDIRNRRGITEFKVVCDETTNTPVRIDRNELWCRVFIRPTKTAEVIIFELNLTNQSAQLG